MGMPMSERPNASYTQPDALAHAGEVAQWAVMLLGWLWLGEQGMRLGWSVASGVLAVVLWWAARLMCRGSAWALQAGAWRMGVCGLLTACGVWLPSMLAAWDMAHWGLLLVALLWGAWSGLVETRSRVSTFQMGLLAWHPVLAGCLVAVAWHLSGGESDTPWGVSLLLALGAAVLHARDRCTVQPMSACWGPRVGWAVLLTPSAMGLMMGSLWLGNVWCAGLGWRTETMVVWHLALMAGAPALVAWTWRWKTPAGQQTPTWHEKRAHLGFCVSLVLLALGALMLLGQSAVHGVLAMLLPSLAWAVHCVRPRDGRGALSQLPPWLARTTALLLGPGLLLWVGWLSPTYGPAAMQMAMALLGGLAALQALFLWWRRPALQPAWFTP